MKRYLGPILFATIIAIAGCGATPAEDELPRQDDDGGGSQSEKSLGRDMFDSGGGRRPDSRELEGLWRRVDPDRDNRGNEVTYAWKFNLEDERLTLGVRCRFNDSRGLVGFARVRVDAEFDDQDRIKILRNRKHIARRDYLNQRLPQPCVASLSRGFMFVDMRSGSLYLKAKANGDRGKPYYKVED